MVMVIVVFVKLIGLLHLNQIGLHCQLSKADALVKLIAQSLEIY